MDSLLPAMCVTAVMSVRNTIVIDQPHGNAFVLTMPLNVHLPGNLSESDRNWRCSAFESRVSTVAVIGSGDDGGVLSAKRMISRYNHRVGLFFGCNLGPAAVGGKGPQQWSFVGLQVVVYGVLPHVQHHEILGNAGGGSLSPLSERESIL
jgi:hypothetical protein